MHKPRTSQLQHFKWLQQNLSWVPETYLCGTQWRKKGRQKTITTTICLTAILRTMIWNPSSTGYTLTLLCNSIKPRHMIAYRIASRRCVATPFLRSERDTHIPRTPQTAGTPILLHKMARPRSPWSLLCFFLRVTTSLVNFQSPKLSRVEGFSLSLIVWTKVELLLLNVSYLADRSSGWDKTDGTTFRSVLSRLEALLGTNCVITVSFKEDVIDTSSEFWEGYVWLRLALDSIDFL